MFFRGFFFFSILAFLDPLPVAAQAEDLLTLEKCIELTLANNQEIAGGNYGVQAAEAQLSEAQANFWPVIDYQYRAAPVPQNVDTALQSFFGGDITMFNSVSLGIGVPLTGFGQLKKAQELARTGVAAAQQKRQKTAADRVLDVKKLYYGIQLGYEAENIIADALKKIDQKIRDDEKKELPEISPIDMAQLKLFRLELLKREQEVFNNTKLAEQGLRIQIGLPDTSPVRLASYRLAPQAADLSSMEKYFGEKLPQQNDAKLAELGVEAKRQMYELEKSKLRPRLGVGAFLETGKTVSAIQGLNSPDDFNDPFNYARAGLGLQLEGRFDFHGASSKIRRAEAEYYKANIERNIAVRGLDLKAQKAFLQAQKAKNDVARATEGKKLARQMTFLSKSNLDLGVGDSKSYADALKTYLQCKGDYVQAVFHYNVALAELEQVSAR